MGIFDFLSDAASFAGEGLMGALSDGIDSSTNQAKKVPLMHVASGAVTRRSVVHSMSVRDGDGSLYATVLFVVEGVSTVVDVPETQLAALTAVGDELRVRWLDDGTIVEVLNVTMGSASMRTRTLTANTGSCRGEKGASPAQADSSSVVDAGPGVLDLPRPFRSLPDCSFARHGTEQPWPFRLRHFVLHASVPRAPLSPARP